MKPYWKRTIFSLISWNMFLVMIWVGTVLIRHEGQYELGINTIALLFFLILINRIRILSAKRQEKKNEHGEVSFNPRLAYGTPQHRFSFIFLAVMFFISIYILWDLVHYKGEFTFGSETWIVFGLLALIVVILYFLYNTKVVKSMYSDLLPPSPKS